MESHTEDREGVSPNIGAAYEITVFDKDGKVKQVVKDDAKCYVQNFLRMIKSFMLNGRDMYQRTFPIPSNFKNLSGSIVLSYGISGDDVVGGFLANAIAGDITKGIVVGTDLNAVIADDFKLGNIITHGNGSGNLFYDQVAFQKLPPDGSKIVIIVSRMVNNNTADPVSFSEIGLYQLGVITIMTLRDVVSPAITLSSGESALIAYKLIING